MYQIDIGMQDCGECNDFHWTLLKWVDAVNGSAWCNDGCGREKTYEDACKKAKECYDKKIKSTF